MKKKIVTLLLAIVGGGFSAPIFPVAAQNTEVGALVDRLDRLSHELNDLQRYVFKGTGREIPGDGAVPAPVDASRAAGMEVRLSELADEFRSLTGNVEELAHDIRVLNERIERLVVDVDSRLSAIEQARVSASVPATPDTLPGTPSFPQVPSPSLPASPGSGILGTLPFDELPPSATVPEVTPEEHYRLAYQKMLDRRWPEAEINWKGFIENYPDHTLASNAYYWLGETFYVRNDFENSAVIFARGYEKFPNGNKAPDILLKLGMALANLGQKNDACVTFAELGKIFPKAPETIKLQSARESKRAGCA